MSQHCAKTIPLIQLLRRDAPQPCKFTLNVTLFHTRCPFRATQTAQQVDIRQVAKRFVYAPDTARKPMLLLGSRDLEQLVLFAIHTRTISVNWEQYNTRHLT